MKILALMGSPRTGGNTDILTDKALEGAKSTGALVQKLTIGELDISPCTEKEYNKVDENGFSVVEDDLAKVYGSILSSDAVIIASPVFFGSISAQMKTMIDRFQFAWVSENVLGKKVFPEKKLGGFICVASQDREEFYNNSREIVRHFFATINIEPIEEEFFSGVDSKASVLSHPDLLEKAYQLGKRIAEARK